MKPVDLKKGDKVAIIAPSGRVYDFELDGMLNRIKNWGLTPVLGKHLFCDYNNGYHYAGTSQQRSEDFQWAIDNDEIKAIWCARGGYGAVQIIDLIQWDTFLQNPKWIIGYSDITAFHNHLNNKGIETLHGLTIKQLNVDYTPETFDTLKCILFGQKLNYTIPNHPLNREGKAIGKLVGGNLSIIYSLLGSKSSIQGDDLLLFIEDWNENWYHLDRMLTNVKRNGLFKQIKGLIVGSFTKMDIKEENPNFHANFDLTSNELIHKFIENYDFPVCFQFPAGHIGDNRALILGSQVELNISNTNATLEFS
ncbi:MAG: LD-carboxypeptidase [Moheibacter sp.]